MYFFETKFMATMNAEELIYTQACASVDYMNRNNQEHQVMMPEFQTFDTLREHKVVCTLLNVLNYIKEYNNEEKYVLIATRDNSGNIIYKIIQNKE